MTEPTEDRPTFLPIAVAGAIVVIALGGIGVLRFFRGDDVPDSAAVGEAVVGQNDALQRSDYADFRMFTCAAQQGVESQVLGDQKQSVGAKGHRFVDDVKDVSVTGDAATATVVYHFEKSADDKLTAPMSFVRENGSWKVCSPGPK